MFIFLDILDEAHSLPHPWGANWVAFFIIGEAHFKKYFERLKRFVKNRGLQEHVIFTGWREDIPAVLSSLDILVSFSGGSVMFEAMACGATIVSAGFTRREVSFHIQDGRTGVILDTAILHNWLVS